MRNIYFSEFPEKKYSSFGIFKAFAMQRKGLGDRQTVRSVLPFPAPSVAAHYSFSRYSYQRHAQQDLVWYEPAASDGFADDITEVVKLERHPGRPFAGGAFAASANLRMGPRSRKRQKCNGRARGR